jgi:hypothetical protein
MNLGEICVWCGESNEEYDLLQKERKATTASGNLMYPSGVFNIRYEIMV